MILQGKESQCKRVFSAGAKKLNSLKELLAGSDIVSLHCVLTNDTVQLINADSLQHIKPGSYVFNLLSFLAYVFLIFKRAESGLVLQMGNV